MTKKVIRNFCGRKSIFFDKDENWKNFLLRSLKVFLKIGWGISATGGNSSLPQGDGRPAGYWHCQGLSSGFVKWQADRLIVLISIPFSIVALNKSGDNCRASFITRKFNIAKEILWKPAVTFGNDVLQNHQDNTKR